jgi:hypothetical protein
VLPGLAGGAVHLTFPPSEDVWLYFAKIITKVWHIVRMAHQSKPMYRIHRGLQSASVLCIKRVIRLKPCPKLLRQHEVTVEQFWVAGEDIVYSETRGNPHLIANVGAELGEAGLELRENLNGSGSGTD